MKYKPVMRKIEIALIIVVAITIGIIFSYSSQASRYGNFTEAFAEEGNQVGCATNSFALYQSHTPAVVGSVDKCFKGPSA